MSNVYIDFERNNLGEFIEIGAVAVDITTGKIKEFHQIIKQKLVNKWEYITCAENSHCIPHETLISEGVEETKAKILFQFFLNNLSLPINFYGHGSDTEEDYILTHFPMMKSLYATYNQVSLPQWSERDGQSYFYAAYLMKSTSEMFSCSYKNHTIQYLPFKMKLNKTLNTDSQLCKYKFKYHCALFDAYMLAFYTNDIPYYCCDNHFKQNFTQKLCNYTNNVYCIKNINDTFIIEYQGTYCNNLPFIYTGEKQLCNLYVAPPGMDVID